MPKSQNTVRYIPEVVRYLCASLRSTFADGKYAAEHYLRVADSYAAVADDYSLAAYGYALFAYVFLFISDDILCLADNSPIAAFNYFFSAEVCFFQNRFIFALPFGEIATVKISNFITH